MFFSSKSRGRTSSRASETDRPRRGTRECSLPRPRFTSAPSIFDSAYVDVFDSDSDDLLDDYTTTPLPPRRPPPPPNSFNNPWAQQRPRPSHLSDTPPQSPTDKASTTRGHHSSRHRERTPPPRSAPPSQQSQSQWERNYLRVFEKEYAQDHLDNNRASLPSHSQMPRPRKGFVDLRMSGALPPPSSTSGSSLKGGRSSRSDKEPSERARKPSRSDSGRRRSESHRSHHRRHEKEDEELARAMERSLRSFAEEQAEGRRRHERRKHVSSVQNMTPWYRRRGQGGSVDEALKTRVARRVDEQNEEIARRMAGGEEGRRDGRRRVRFPEDS